MSQWRNWVGPAQHSPEWFARRGQMLTASDIAAVLGINPYESREDVMLKKLGFKRAQRTDHTSHGTRLEPEARDKYVEKTGESVFEIGLEPHPQIPWLGGSPDGITDSGKLLEIKCPATRQITGAVPKYYIPQVQLLMEIFNLEECDFVQYRPDPEIMTITRVTRDREWFAQALPILKSFWDELHERKNKSMCEIVD